MTQIIQGIVHGKTIELENETGLPEGQQVIVSLAPAEPFGKSPEDGLASLRRAAGKWSDDPKGLDAFLEWNRQQRKVNRDELPP